MNISRSRQRRSEIVAEQGDIASKHRRSTEDNRRFDELQGEFDRVHAEILRFEAEHGPDPGPILPEPASSSMGGSSAGFSSRMAGMDPVARQWVGAVLERRRAAGGETRALTLSGDLNVDIPLAPIGLKPDRARFVSDLVGRKTIDGPTATWLRETSFTNAAAAVAKGGTKPESALELTRETADLSVIAHLISDIHNVDLEDEQNLQQVIGNRLFYGLKLELDDQLINGNGTTPNLQGILDAGSGVATVSVAPEGVLTTLRKARTALQDDNVVPTHTIMAPADAEALDLLIDMNERPLFQVDGPVDAEQGRVWGTQIVVSPALAAGTAIMGDFADAITLVTHESGTRLSIDPFTGFKVNETDFRAEFRAAVAYTQPYALRIVDISP